MEDALRLVVLEGPDDPLVGREIVISEDDATLGRSPSSTHCLPAPTVSRSHARVQRREGRWMLADLGSKSGVFINGLRLEPGVPALLERGDELIIGPWRFRVGDRGAVDAPTMALTTTTGMEAKTAATSHAPSRRLQALSRCIDRLAHATTEADLAEAALESAIEGAGFRRGVVLRPGSGADAERLEVLRARELRSDGWREPAEADLQPSSALVSLAMQGQTAVFSTRADDMVIESASLVEAEVHSAVCAPVTVDGRIVALLYLDARAGEAPVRDATAFCEDVAQVFGLALAYAARAELMKRQAAMQAELERARSLRAMLTPPERIDAGPYRIAHRTIAGLFVSGDLFDVVRQPDGAGVVLFGDATGHGVGAAMLTALVHAHLHAHVAREPDPMSAVIATNAFVADRPAGGSFVSLWAGRLGSNGRIDFVDAGHGHVLVARAGGDVETGARATGIPLGIDAGASYDQAELRLEPGDRIVLYTDGVPEQRAADGKPIGAEGVIDALHGSADAEDDVRRIVDALIDATAGRGVEDDATVASIEYRPA